MTTERAVLYRKIAAVTAAVSRIPKNGHNKFFSYDYATESDITDALRALLHEHGLAFLPPSVLAWERNETGSTTQRGDANTLTRVQMQFELACTESGAVYTAQLWGEGQDSGDKGFYKAYTGAVKYFLMKTFLIATGDDPERDERSPDPPRQQRASPKPAAASATSGNNRRPALINRIWILQEQAGQRGIEVKHKPLNDATEQELVEIGKAYRAALGPTPKETANG